VESFRLLPDEREVLHGMVAARRLGISGGPALVLLTDRRLCILDHFFFKPDRGLECPRGSILSITRKKVLPGMSFLRLDYRAEQGRGHFDFARVSAMSLAVAAIGVAPVSPELLMDQMHLAWGEDAPRRWMAR